VYDSEALIVRNNTLVDLDLLDHALGLKVIGRLGVGMDNIDVDSALKKGAQLTYAGIANSVSVAEFIFAMLLMLSRPRLVEADRHVQAGNWDRKSFYGLDLCGKKLGLIGFGKIGTRVGRRALAFGMNVYFYDPYISDYHYMFEERTIHRVDLDRLVSISDYISIQVPLNLSTRNVIGRAQPDKMKESAFLINISRGGIVDELALYKALRDRTIAGATLDLREYEPPPKNHSLHGLKNCILTPHVAGRTEESQDRTSIIVAEDIMSVLAGKKAQFPYFGSEAHKGIE
jgi:D-3-phosphoglycerate dehydrogenase/(S)-sulfolactate dehydrogenase